MLSITALRRSLIALATAAALSAHASIHPTGLAAMAPAHWDVEAAVAELVVDHTVQVAELMLPVEEIAAFEVTPVVATTPKRHHPVALTTLPQPTTVSLREDAPVALPLPPVAGTEVISAEVVLVEPMDHPPAPLPAQATLPMLPAPAPTSLALLPTPKQVQDAPPAINLEPALTQEESLEDRLFKPYFALASLWFSAATAFIPTVEA